jgi:flagellar FliL protein
MAKGENSDLDLAVDKKSSPLLGVLINIGVGLLLVAVNVGVTYFLVGMMLDEQSSKILAAQQSLNAIASGDASNTIQAPTKPPIFIPLKPVFVVNLGNLEQGRFVQTEIQVMTRDPETGTAVESLMPMIRNAVILILSQQDVDALGAREGMDKLQQQVLDEVNAILQTNGHASGVEDVYFTSFVTQ